MAPKRRAFSVFTLSFLDVMCCAFGAVVLLFMILKHEAVEQERIRKVDLGDEVAALNTQLADTARATAAANADAAAAEARLVALGGASTLAEKELARLRTLSTQGAAPVVTQRDIDALKLAIRKLESEKSELLSQLNAQSHDVRQYLGQGNREYLTGIRTGGKRVLILLDNSASMLDVSIVNVLRKRNMDDATRRRSEKWRQALDTVDWISAHLGPGTQYQIYTFNGRTDAVVPGTTGQWLDVDNARQFNDTIARLKTTTPEGGSNLTRALQAVAELKPAPDNVFLITDGLPTQGLEAPNGHPVSGDRRNEFFAEAMRQLPQPAPPFNVILLPMEGDPMAAWAYWSVAMSTHGAFLTPAYDWP